MTSFRIPNTGYEYIELVRSDGVRSYATGAVGAGGEWIYTIADPTFNNGLSFSAIALEHTQTVVSHASTAASRLAVVQSEFGASAQLADFSDVQRAYSLVGNNLVNYIDLKEVNLPNIGDYDGKWYNNEGPFITYGGATHWSSTGRAFFISAHDGQIPVSWLVHDSVGSNQIDVGSWIYDRQILAKVTYSSSQLLFSSSSASVEGTDGNDLFIAGAAVEAFYGRQGSDTVSYEVAASGVIASLSNPASNSGFAAGDTFSSIENLTGSAFNDVLTGDANDNTLMGGLGDDTLDGGDGTDTADYSTATSGVTVTLAGSPTLTAASITNPATQFFNPANGHIYEVRNEAVTWTEALNRSAQATLGGYTGYLATSTSAAENTFLTNLTLAHVTTGWNNNTVWLAGSDAAVEGVWRWVAGPEAGQQFWSGGSGGSATVPQYWSWYVGNPANENGASGLSGSFSNPTGTGSDFLFLYGSVFGAVGSYTGRWDDAYSSITAVSTPSSPIASSDGVRNAYIIEFGGVVGSGGTATGGAGNDQLISIENVTGSAFNDVLTGDERANTLIGGSGDDLLDGGAGDDVLDGGDGADTLIGGDGDDTLIGGAGGIGQFGLGSPMVLPAGSWPHSVAFSDLNADGFVDVLVGNEFSQTVSIYFNTGIGGLQPALSLASGGRSAYAYAGDVNGDGRPDIVTANYYDGTISYLRANADGTFSAPVVFSAGGSSVITLALTDINNDGSLDIVAPIDGQNVVKVFLNDGQGSFSLSGTYQVGSAPNVIQTADFNGDGYADVAVSNYGGYSMSVLLNDKAGGFLPQTQYSGGDWVLGVGDIDNDGDTDIVSGTRSGVVVWKNNGAGGMTQATVLNQGVAVGSIDLKDINGDGNLDLVGTTQSGPNSVVTMLGDGQGGFLTQTWQALSLPSLSYAAAAGDLNGDGLPEVISANAGANSISVFMNATTSGGPNILVGGLGNDIYVVSNAGDVVTENPDEGIDEVRTPLGAYTLGANVENLTYTGSGNFIGTGNELANVIAGGAGDDTLSGGVGDDTLDGGEGNDTADYSTATTGVTVTLSGGGSLTQASITNPATQFFWDPAIGGNGHIYEVRNQAVTWTEAMSLSAQASLGGQTGYLATSTSEAENRFLTSLVISHVTTGWDNNTVWLAGSDAAEEGVWRWMAGPETGQQFWSGGGSGNATVPQHWSWYGSDPNNENAACGRSGCLSNPTGTGSDYLFLYGIYGSNGLWDDAYSSTTAVTTPSSPIASPDGLRTAYIVEYGGLLNSRGIATGGAGTDQLINMEHVIGSAFADTVIGNSGDNILAGMAGNDTLEGGSGSDTLDGGIGSDTLIGGAGDDIYLIDDVGDTTTEGADEGTDEVRTTLATYTLGANVENLTYTGSGNFIGTGNELANVITGGAGDDTLDGGSGDDTLDGGAGIDTADYSTATTGVTVTLSGGGSLTQASITNPATQFYWDPALGGNGHVYEIVNASVDWTTALNGAAAMTLGSVVGHLATITTAAENEFVKSKLGGYSFVWLAGSDADQEGVWKWVAGPEAGTIFSNGANAVPGGFVDWAGGQPDNSANEDFLHYAWGVVAWNDVYPSFTSPYLVEYSVAVSAGGSATGGAGSDQLLNMENVIGSAFDDTLFGDVGDNVLDGGDGNDTLHGDAGNDTLVGGAGADTMSGGIGNDVYVVDSTSDVVVESPDAGTDEIRTTLNQYTLSSTTALTAAHITDPATQYFNPANGHIYQYVLNAGTWDQAFAMAQAQSLGGTRGYLATVTSAEEQQFIWSNIPANPPLGWWLGGNDIGTQGVWRWVDGPEAGQQFWEGGGNGSTVNGSYAYWDQGALPPQPNGPDYPGSGERYVIIQGNIPWNNLTAGYWGDDNSSGHSYGSIIEFGGLGGTSGQSAIENLTFIGAGDFVGTGNDLNNVITGGGGNDVLDGGGGNDRLVGGAGTDTAIFSGVRQSYDISENTDGTLSVVGVDGADTTDGVELFQFADGTYTRAQLFAAAPVATDSSFTLAEDSIAEGAVSATDVNGDLLTYGVVTGPTNGSLTLTADGSWTYTPNADFAGNDSFTFVANDGALSSQPATVSLTVTAVDDAPEIVSNGGASSAALSVAENTSAVTVIVATDADPGTTLTYSIAGGADAALFQIDATTGALAFVSAPDFEAPADVGSNNIYDVVVQASDGTLADTQALAVSVADVNEAPTGISFDGASLSAADITNPATQFFWDPALGGNGHVYEVVSRLGTWTEARDLAAGMTLAGAVGHLVTITSAAENAFVVALPGTDLGFIGASDAAEEGVWRWVTGPEAGTVFWRAGTGAEPGQYVNWLAGQPDNYPNSPTGEDYGQLYAGTWNDAPDAAWGHITSQSFIVEYAQSAPSIAENNAPGALITTLTAQDPDGPGSGFAGPFTYALVAGDGDADNAAFSIVGNELRLNGTADFETKSSYSVRVQVTDAGGLSYATSTLVRVTNANDAPVIISDGAGPATTIALAENTTAVTTVQATDVDPGTTLTYSIAGGADAALFQIDATTGALAFVSAPDFEAPGDSDGDNIYRVTVGVSDGALSDTQELTVSVTNAVGVTVNGTVADDVITPVSTVAGGLFPTGEEDELFGAEGDDTLDGGAGADMMAGGQGDDIYVVDDIGDVVVEGAEEGVDEVRTSLSSYTLGENVENLRYVGTGDFTGTGNSLANVMVGGAGNDILFGAEGRDTFVAGLSDGDDHYDGGEGGDTYSLAALTEAVVVDLVAGSAIGTQSGHDTLVSIEHVIGGLGDDHIMGDAGSNRLSGGGGNDTLYGGIAGSDILEGGAGNDTYIVDRGFSITVREFAGEGTDTVMASVTYVLGQNLENLILTGSADINGTGNMADNVLTGNSGANVLSGGLGNDRFVASIDDGNDSYVGGLGIDTLDLSLITSGVDVNLVTGRASGAQIGNDTLSGIENVIGGSGADRITAGSGANVLTGGDGADVFAWLTTAAARSGVSRDIVTDFVQGVDRIDLSGIDANTRIAGDQAFKLLLAPGAAFTRTPGELRYAYESGNTIISGDVNGDGVADFQIQLIGAIALNPGDFTP